MIMKYPIARRVRKNVTREEAAAMWNDAAVPRATSWMPVAEVVIPTTPTRRVNRMK